MAHKHAQDLSVIEKAKFYAIEKHKYVNQSYDMYPYSFHLDMVYKVAKRFIDLIPIQDRDEVLAGTWVHDIIEDARENYNDVLEETNEVVAEYAYALTNPKGKNREQRNRKEYYDGLKLYKHASFIKLCDRIANIEFSRKSGNSMYKKYQREAKEFRAKLDDGRWDEMWKYLESKL